MTTRIFAVLVWVGLIVLTVVGGCATRETAKSEASAQLIADVSPKEALALIEANQNNPNFVIIDVRTPAEFSSGHIARTVNLDYNAADFRNRVNKLDKNKTYLIYCRTGHRSANAIKIMAELDFKTVYNMAGGIAQWTAEGRPVTR